MGRFVGFCGLHWPFETVKFLNGKQNVKKRLQKQNVKKRLIIHCNLFLNRLRRIGLDRSTNWKLVLPNKLSKQ